MELFNENSFVGKAINNIKDAVAKEQKKEKSFEEIWGLDKRCEHDGEKLPHAHCTKCAEIVMGDEDGMCVECAR